MHDVGDILYIISSKKRNVIPVQVTQQIVRRSLGSGDETIYMVTLPKSNPGDEDNVVRLGAINGQVFQTLEEARHALTEQANKAINEVLEHAAEVEKENFHNSTQPAMVTGNNSEPYDELEMIQPPNPPVADEEVLVAMPDGTEAKLHVPKEYIPQL